MIDIKELARRTDLLFPELLDTLCELIRIPSVSAMGFDQNEVRRSAEFVASLLENAGLDTQIVSSAGPDGWEGRPAVLAKRHDFPGAPTILLYAHHDVQPVGDLSRWTTPPYDPVVREGRLYGRGSSDDGAGIMVHLGALQVLAEELGINVSVFIEGEEEVGSPSFRNFLTEYKEELEAEVIVVADSDNWKVGIPAITTSLRGVVECIVEVKVLDHAVHSGMFGGPILDAVTLAARLIATLHDEKGNVAVEGLGGIDQSEVLYPEDEFRADAGIVPGYQLAGTGSLAARLWTKPAISIIGLDTDSIAEAASTITPTCTFKVALRTVPGADTAVSIDLLMQHLTEHAPFGAEVTVTPATSGPSYQADLSSPATADMHWALATAWGVPSVNIGVGGSIPFISDFKEFFPDAQIVVTGVEDPRTNAHSEDESQSLPDLRNAILAEALFITRLAGNL